ncbi:MAG: RDD family protein [Candidatus Hodarchaeales archaeon]|jgi:uncharacterized RDD family membrane protein YckC
MSKNKLLDPISSYIQEIDRLLPYSKEKKKPVLNELRQEVQDALKNGKKAPHLVFGSPSEVAKNLSSSHDWKTTPAGWGIRTLAFTFDGILIVGFCLLYLIFGFVLVLRIDLWQFLTLTGLSEVFNELQSDLELGTFLILGLLGLFYALGAVIIYSAYFIVLEKIFSATIGKRVLGLQAVDISGIRLTWKQAIVRNFSKLPGFAEFLPFDIILGMLMNERGQGEYQRATDILAETIVVRSK